MRLLLALLIALVASGCCHCCKCCLPVEKATAPLSEKTMVPLMSSTLEYFDPLPTTPSTVPLTTNGTTLESQKPVIEIGPGKIVEGYEFEPSSEGYYVPAINLPDGYIIWKNLDGSWGWGLPSDKPKKTMPWWGDTPPEKPSRP